jgi:gamma-carbonic anhydrase
VPNTHPAGRVNRQSRWSDQTAFSLHADGFGFLSDQMNDVSHQLDVYLLRKPSLGQGVFLAHGSRVIGDVQIGDHSSVWHNAVLRADLNRIVVGHHTNIQDNAVLHVADDLACLIGHYVTVGHSAVLHACTIGDETLIGMGAVILDGALVGQQCLVGAHALVTGGTSIPEGSLVLGAPAKVIRSLTDEEKVKLKARADKYSEMAAYYLTRLRSEGVSTCGNT